jgi:hypothetical protein
MALAGCASAQPAAPAGPPAPTVGDGGPVALREVWPLERIGPSPSDTVVRFAAATGRTIVLRHPRPDHAVFVIVSVPPGAFRPQAGDSVSLRFEPLPGRYGVTIRSTDSLVGIALGTFSYAVHFAQPDGSTSRYPTSTRFEAAMGAARMLDSTSLRFLPTERPAGDMTRFAIGSLGTYLLAAPR